MTFFTSFQSPATAGFQLLAGRVDGLRRLMLASGRVPAGAPVTMHQHAGDEMVRIISGEVMFRVGDERRLCQAGDIAVIPPDTVHGFRVLSDAVLEVFAEQDIGTFLPVRVDGGEQLVEIFTPSPWNRPPPRGRYTTDEELEALRRQIDLEV